MASPHQKGENECKAGKKESAKNYFSRNYKLNCGFLKIGLRGEKSKVPRPLFNVYKATERINNNKSNKVVLKNQAPQIKR